MTYKTEYLQPGQIYRLIPIVALAATLVLAWWSYSPGFSGGWHFDDYASLNGLEQVDSLTTGLVFSTSGIAGPLKRPVALATFALQAEDWPDNPPAFLKANTCIHVLNGALVYWLALSLAGFLAPEPGSGKSGFSRRHWFALSVASAWVFSPFLASASLMAVQRMTTLAACFMFVGLIGYLAGRRWMLTRRDAGLLLALFSLGAGTLLAALAKENGLLLPLLALLCELLIINRALTPPRRLPRAWFHLALSLPSGLVIGYLAWRGIKGAMGAGYGGRSFDLFERLLTQARALWDYMFNLAFPQAGSVTPYSDAYPLSHSLLDPATTLLSVAGLVALLVLALILKRRWPAVVFGLAWFFGAHLIESTTVALELYFAHRNYAPAFGLFFALAWPLFFSRPLRNIVWIGPIVAAVFVAVSAAVLAYSTWIWGRPEIAAQSWHERSPTSVRASLTLSSVYASRGSNALADRILARGIKHHPENQIIRLQRLQYCPKGESDLQRRLVQARAALAAPKTIRLGTAIGLHRFVLAPDDLPCPLLTREHLAELGRIALMDTSRHQSERTTEYIHYSLAHLAQGRSAWPAMRNHLERALNLKPDPQTAILIAWSWALQDDLVAARRYLRTQLASPPEMNWLERLAWKKELRSYLEILES